MRTFLGLLLCGAVLMAGCVSHSTSPTASATPLITPDLRVIGIVVSVNDTEHYAVLRYPLGKLPKMDAQLSVFRNGIKTAEIKITGPERRDIITAAAIISGDVQPKDEVWAEGLEGR